MESYNWIQTYRNYRDVSTVLFFFFFQHMHETHNLVVGLVDLKNKLKFKKRTFFTAKNVRYK